MIFEGRKLVHDYHVVIEARILDKPLHVLAVYDVEVGFRAQRFDPLLFRSDRYAVSEVELLICAITGAKTLYNQ